ncbi:hypothetical protein C7S16_6153 [Burkholderia thailandensis]|uniref:Uncharacterized protein n=1 Tax=Burkholderia thailandensis TaxID=57975 RepID=A0AAW9CMV4_BURTH|nr:hypothetical protein [Burkholderia thailandensis]MDW9252295.1 hypothetical protein [Burkholderia thailandensis]
MGGVFPSDYRDRRARIRAAIARRRRKSDSLGRPGMHMRRIAA